MTGEFSPRDATLVANLKTIADLLTDVRRHLAQGADHGTTLLAVPRTLTGEEVATIEQVARLVADRSRSLPLTSTTMRLIRVMEDVVEAQDCAARDDGDGKIHMGSAAARLVEALAQMASRGGAIVQPPPSGEGAPS